MVHVKDIRLKRDKTFKYKIKNKTKQTTTKKEKTKEKRRGSEQDFLQ